ncbi:hypothetical protein DL96DRAFT_17765 [Flagelloscypha sp. PMI_526]|nr:hypothetical protein DL96DRAFT_17765 [Flagelloscypha sp. PMI_526]
MQQCNKFVSAMTNSSSMWFMGGLGPFAQLYAINPSASCPYFQCLGSFASPASDVDMFGFSGERLLYLSRDQEDRQFLGVYYCKEELAVQWSSGSIVYDDLDILDDMVIATPTTMNEVDAFRLPNPSDHPDYKAGDVLVIENPSLYFISWQRDLDLLGTVRSIMPASFASNSFLQDGPSPRPYRWESIVRTTSDRVFVVDQIMRPYPGTTTINLSTYWAPDIMRVTAFDQTQFPIGRWDSPYSITSEDGWRMMWWENDDETKIR